MWPDQTFLSSVSQDALVWRNKAANPEPWEGQLMSGLSIQTKKTERYLHLKVSNVHLLYAM
jgi:hypothetical protein